MSTQKENIKVAIVTGASSGLGKAIALKLNQNGWSLIVHGRNARRLDSVVNEMSSPDQVVAIAGEVNDKQQRQQIVETALEKFGRIDALVNNAGVFSPKPFLEVTEADLDVYLSTNLKGTFFLSQAVLPTMLSQKDGSILNLGSVLVEHALGGVPTTAPITIKGGIHSFTRQLAAEYGKDNIRVNTLAPGIIRSPMHQANGVEDDSMAGLHLLNRIGEANEIASIALEILENKFINGTTINVDGGHVAGHNLA